MKTTLPLVLTATVAVPALGADAFAPWQVRFARPVEGSVPYVLVIDRLTGEGPHKLDQHWHLPPGEITVSPEQMGGRTTFADGGNLLVHAVMRDGVELRPGLSAITSGYRKKQERPDVCFTREGELPALFVTLLVPFAGTEPPALECRLASGEADGIVAVDVTHAGGRDLVFAAPEATAGTLHGRSVVGRAGLLRDANGSETVSSLVGE